MQHKLSIFLPQLVVQETMTDYSQGIHQAIKRGLQLLKTFRGITDFRQELS